MAAMSASSRPSPALTRPIADTRLTLANSTAGAETALDKRFDVWLNIEQ
jgi:hypothetical protein